MAEIEKDAPKDEKKADTASSEALRDSAKTEPKNAEPESSSAKKEDGEKPAGADSKSGDAKEADGKDEAVSPSALFFSEALKTFKDAKTRGPAEQLAKQAVERGAKEGDKQFELKSPISEEGKAFADAWAGLPNSAGRSLEFANPTFSLSEKFGINGTWVSDLYKSGKDGIYAFGSELYNSGIKGFGLQPALAGARLDPAVFGFEKVNGQLDFDSTKLFDSFSKLDSLNQFKAFVGRGSGGSEISSEIDDFAINKTLKNIKEKDGLIDKAVGAVVDAVDAAASYAGNAVIGWFSNEAKAAEPASKDAMQVKEVTGSDSVSKASATSSETAGIKDGIAGTSDATKDGKPAEKPKVTEILNADGKKEVKVESGDNTLLKKADGSTLLSNKQSDIDLKHLPGGGVEVTDKTGKKVLDFGTAGDATIYFKNAVTEVVKPGTSLENAFVKLQQEKGDAIKGKDVVILDGKGESLIVQPDGTKIRRHENGNVEMLYHAKDAHGKEHDVHVRIKQTPNGQLVRLAKTATGEEIELKDPRANQWLNGSRIRVLNNQLMVRDLQPGESVSAKIATQSDLAAPGADPGAKPGSAKFASSPDAASIAANPLMDKAVTSENLAAAPDAAFARKLIEGNIIKPSDTVELNNVTGVLKVIDTEKKEQTIFTPNRETGVAVAQTFKLNDSGVPESEPIRTVTMDHGRNTIQGKNPADTVQYDANRNDLRAWDMTSDSNGARVHSAGGDVFVDRNNQYYRENVEQRTATERIAQSEYSQIMAGLGALMGLQNLKPGSAAMFKGGIARLKAMFSAADLPIPAGLGELEGRIDELEAKAVRNLQEDADQIKKNLDSQNIINQANLRAHEIVDLMLKHAQHHEQLDHPERK